MTVRETDPVTDTLPDDAPHLLVVDDDRRIRDLLSRYLGTNGYRVTVAASAADARRKLSGLSFDMLILDVMMPDETGFELAASLKDNLEAPILFLTAKSDPEDRIQGLELGGGDYLGKPFEPRELLLRIGNLLRRGTLRAPAASGREIRFGPFTFQVERLELKQGDRPVRLTDRERQLLKIFAESPGETIARHLLVGEDGNLGERTADVQINRLRRKIEPDPANPVYLQTVRGIGYRLMADE
ncbi:MAG: DNA-binding response regulator [Hyphomicrobiales bacterium]|nr:MAG: DNA-binding response regulator [Hyphomicrobiales bacterium]